MTKMTCEGCMYQRYRMTDKGQAWFCRRESSDEVPIFHYAPASECECMFRGDNE